MKREILMRAALAGGMLLGGCESSPDHAGEITTTTVDQSRAPWDMKEAAKFFGNVALADFQPDYTERITEGEVTLDFMTTGGLRRYSQFVREHTSLVLEIEKQLPPFSMNFMMPNGTTETQTYSSEPRGARLNTVILLPESFGITFPAEAQTAYSTLKDKKGRDAYVKTITVVQDTLDPTENPLSDAIKSTENGLFTELCQSIVEAKPNSLPTNSIEMNYAVQAQELLCNSLGRAYSSAAAGLSYPQYVEVYTKTPVTVTGLSLPTLIAPESLFDRLSSASRAYRS